MQKKYNFAVSCHYLFSKTLFIDRSTKSPGLHRTACWIKRRLCEIGIHPIPTIEASELLRLTTHEPQMERILSTQRVSDAVNPASGQGPTACVERLA
jgi:hypothetical protein